MECFCGISQVILEGNVISAIFVLNITKHFILTNTTKIFQVNLLEFWKIDVCGICGCKASEHQQYNFNHREIYAIETIVKIYS